MRKLTSLLCAAFAVFGYSGAQADQSGAVRNPIVLAHGFASDADGFFGVANALNQVGADNVIATEVEAFESSFARGEELLQQIEVFLAVSGEDKVNIIAHSQGGVDSRYVAGVRPDLVGSVTSLASPHRGVNTADVLDAVTGPLTDDIAGLLDALVILFGASDTTSLFGSLSTLSSDGAAGFNSVFPQGLRTDGCETTPLVNVARGPFRFIFPRFVRDYSVNDGPRVVNGVRYFSLGGVTTLFNNNIADPIDFALAVTSTTFFFESNDGLVGRCSTHLGEVVRDDFTLNHNDFTNATNGLRGLGTDDPLAVYKQHARRLNSRGL